MENLEGIKVSLISLGCDKNLMDSEVMLGLIKEEGMIFTPYQQEAQILVLNTCGFIEDAISESMEHLYEMANLKEISKNEKAIIVTGCMSERYKEHIFDIVPEVDCILGTGNYEDIIYAIKKSLLGEKVLKTSDINNNISEASRIKRIISTPSHYAYIKIAEGCDNFCTYCSIPSLRGNYRSRSMNSLIKEAELLAKQGVKELIVVAQDTSLYGKDLYGEIKIHELLSSFSKISGIEWIRLLYCYPEHITNELITEMSNNPKILHYIDIPIQHASDTVLKRMGRNSNKKQIVEVIEKLRYEMPDIVIRTTLMVGFPDETNDEFNELLDFVQKMEFDRLGTFMYSKEKGTPAFKMPNQITNKVKIQRRDKIMNLQQKISAGKNNSKINKIYKVMIENKQQNENGEILYFGRSYMDCPEVDGIIIIINSNDIKIGSIANVRITKAFEYDLIGEVVDES